MLVNVMWTPDNCTLGLNYTLYTIARMEKTQSNTRKWLLPAIPSQIALGSLKPSQNIVECHRMETKGQKCDRIDHLGNRMQKKGS